MLVRFVLGEMPKITDLHRETCERHPPVSGRKAGSNTPVSVHGATGPGRALRKRLSGAMVVLEVELNE